MHAENLLSESKSKTELSHPEEILSAIRSSIGDWDSWLKSNSIGKDHVPLRKLLSRNALFWGMPTSSVIHQPMIARLLLLKSKPSKTEPSFDFAEAVKSWQQSLNESFSVPSVLEGIAWAHALPHLTVRLGETGWSQLLTELIRLTRVDSVADQPGIIRFLLQVELALTLAHNVSEFAPCELARKSGREQFAVLLDELLDGEGLPHASLLQDIQFLLASCTRSLVMDAEAKKGRVNKAARLQYDWLSRQTLRWAKPCGATILHQPLDSPYFDELVKAAMRLTKDDSDVAAFKLLRGKRKTETADAPNPSEHSEWSELATMRTSWLPQSLRLAVDYSNRSLKVELAAGKETIFSGLSNPHIVVNGELLALESDWEEICWESDKDVDYVELECSMSNGWRVQRQMLLARHDQFVLLADAMVGPQTSDIQYQHTLPICGDTVIEQSPENTETMILGQKKLGHIIPLALPEWKSSLPEQRLRAEPTRLEMSTRANAMYAPLFLCLNPARRNSALTWRQLTVAEELLPVTKEVATAYRVQIGKEQWVIYRSLGSTGNRTFLGLNMISDFMVARFLPSGEIEMLIDVEPS